MSADVVGYSKLMGNDDAATVETLSTQKQVMAALIVKHQGRVIDSPGDNMLSVSLYRQIQAHDLTVLRYFSPFIANSHQLVVKTIWILI